MIYIARRISISSQGAKATEISDQDFLRKDSPLIVLGEPGAGKTELLEQASALYNTRCLNASTITALPELNSESSPVLIDGTDEVTAYQSGTPINNILSKIPQNVNFILSCRAADWQDAVNTNIISQKWQTEPVVGTIIPLNNREIVEFIQSNFEQVDAEDFLREAYRRDVAEMLRNPQHLMLFLEAIHKNEGWPEDRLGLYDSASKRLVQEVNPIHQSINRDHTSIEDSIEVAGFIFAQILLSDNAGVDLESSGQLSYVHPSDLASDQYAQPRIRAALSTKLFRATGKNQIVPCHRTVAEFLAAKWVAKALNNNLSRRRLEAMLYGSNFIVPAALRGLHAWIATLNHSVANQFIQRDPYGIFRYGDPAALTTPSAKLLLAELQKLAEFDPSFSNEDWYATFGKGLAREALRDNIVSIISDSEAPYQLRRLVLKSLQGDSFTNDIRNTLEELAVQSTITYTEREVVIDALSQCNELPDWAKIIHQLHLIGGVDSLRLALKAIELNPKLFDGKSIANTLIALQDAMERESGDHVAGLAYHLHEHLTNDQLEECLKYFVRALVASDRPFATKEEIGRRLFTFIQARLVNEPLPPAEHTWLWLMNVYRDGGTSNDWHQFSYDFFIRRTDYRQAVQAEALKSTLNSEELWDLLWNSRNIFQGLMVSELDLFVHLNHLVDQQSLYPDWKERWVVLVRWGKSHVDFEGLYLKLAELHALQHEVLKPYLEKIMAPPLEDEFSERLAERRKEQEQMVRAQTKRRHESFEGIEDKLKVGRPLKALNQIANAYLGYFPELKGATPLERITELTGEKIAPIALEALAACVAGSEIPTAREIIEAHAENKVYLIEEVLIAYCANQLEKEQSLTHLSLEVAASALACCRWNLSFRDSYTSTVQDELEKLVFANISNREAFVRHTIEPYLSRNSKLEAGPILGLDRLVQEEAFSGIAKTLAVEWIEKHSKLSSYTLRKLLSCTIRCSPNEAIRLTRNYTTEQRWYDENQRDLWMSTAFLIDFNYHRETLTAYVSEHPDRFWPLKNMVLAEHGNHKSWPTMSVAQNHFLITQFGSHWTPTNAPPGAYSSDQYAREASEFIGRRIDELAANLSDEAESLLHALTDTEGLEEYHHRIRHAHRQQVQSRSESSKVLLPIQDIKKILLQGEPTSREDLQAFVLDELHHLQQRIQNGSTNDILPYWNGNVPHNENYCRDRIASALTPYFQRHNIRAHIEGIRQNNTRCDLLCTHDQIDVPIEIKGQWHNQLWEAAMTQLDDYRQHYRSKGRGIYIVLWFGYIKKGSKNPYGGSGRNAPKTLSRMEDMLAEAYDNIPEATKMFVLNLERPAKRE